MNISIDAIKTLREKTGAPLGNIRAALEEAKGDEQRATQILQRKGFESARKRQDRATAAGRIEAYAHHDGRLAVLVEINCETDFVARTPEFQQFCRDVAMQVASQNPSVITKEQLSAKQLNEAKAEDKPADQLAKDTTLLEQPFIKDQGQTIGQYLTGMIAKTGENIVITRFTRFALGETRAA